MRLAIRLFILFIAISVTSCLDSSDINEEKQVGPYARKPVGTFEVNDTVLKSGVYDFSLSLKDYGSADIAKEWAFSDLQEWTDNNTTYSQSPKGETESNDKWESANYEKSDNNRIGNDWITFERVIDDDDTSIPQLHINVKHNDTGKYRAVKLIIDNPSVELSWSDLVIAQKPEPDMSTFCVYARYKGIIHSSTARLNEYEETVYEDKDFSDFLIEFSKKPGIETIVVDNEIVDFIDDDDVAENPQLKSFMEAINDSRPSIVRNDLFFGQYGRANTGFEYMTSSDVGYYALFDNDTFAGTNTYFNAPHFYAVSNIYKMWECNLNDKITSIALAYNGTDPSVCCVLTVWQDADCNNGDDYRTKHRVSFIASYNQPRLTRSHLKNVPFLNSSGNWNDCISSISFHFGNYGSYLVDY